MNMSAWFPLMAAATERGDARLARAAALGVLENGQATLAEPLSDTLAAALGSAEPETAGFLEHLRSRALPAAREHGYL